MSDPRDIESPSAVAAALGLHPFPKREQMIHELLRGKAASPAILDRRARLVTILREQDLWPRWMH